MEINNFYTATVYEKGAEVVRMIQTLIGAEKFRRGMDLYFAKHDGEAATVEDFVDCMAQTSGRDFSQFFRWYDEAGTPDVVAEGYWDKAAGSYQLKLGQHTKPTPGQPHKKPFVIPLRLALVGPDGKDMQLDKQEAAQFDGELLELSQSEQVISFSGITEQPVLSINRGFSAPVNLTTNLNTQDKLFLMAHDNDPFNRFEACQEVGRQLIFAAMECPDQPVEHLDAFVASLRAVIHNNELEDAFVAQMLTLPGHNAIASAQGKNIDPEQIHLGILSITRQISTALTDELEEILQRRSEDSYHPDAQSSGRRALRQAALKLFAIGHVERGAELAFEQFEHAKHMTAEFNALSVLIQLDVKQRSDGLDLFYEKHKDDHLLVDKWFGLHGMTPFPETLGQIRDLLDHEAFSLSKPNTVRALIGGFAMSNPVYFHETDGSGYELFSNVIIELDKINPQVAARLSGALGSWQMLEPVRAQLARAALERINRTEGLSRDTFEMTQRSLGSA